ncbi:replication factor A protein, partial [Trifolium medium]|nr:replication factor A protein [Trifolium medium]
QFHKMVSKCSDTVPVVIIQFAKIKIFRDEVSIQNVINTTRVLVEPNIAEAVSFKDGLALHGVEPSSRVAVLSPRVRPSMEEDFLHTYPVINHFFFSF